MLVNHDQCFRFIVQTLRQKSNAMIIFIESLNSSDD